MIRHLVRRALGRLARPGLIVLLSAVLTGIAAEPATAQELSSQQRVELNKLVKQRNKLDAQLRRLDEQASTMIKDGRDATVVHANQVSVQDQLDLVELRLAILATRAGVAVPPVPGERGDGTSETSEQTRFDRAFSRGRDRAVGRLREDGLRLLASIDFDAFLGRGK